MSVEWRRCDICSADFCVRTDSQLQQCPTCCAREPVERGYDTPAGRLILREADGEGEAYWLELERGGCMYVSEVVGVVAEAVWKALDAAGAPADSQHQDVWLRAFEASRRGGFDHAAATSSADRLLADFKKRFGGSK